MSFSLLVPLPDLPMALCSLSLSVSLFLTLSVPLSLPSLIFSPLNSGACLPNLLLCHFIVESIGFCLGSLPCVVPCKHFKALNCGGYRVHLICFPYISDIYISPVISVVKKLLEFYSFGNFTHIICWIIDTCTIEKYIIKTCLAECQLPKTRDSTSNTYLFYVVPGIE